MAKKVRVGFIGAGGIAGGLHLPGYQALSDVEIVAVADVNPSALASFAARAGVGAEGCFTDYHEMLDKVKLDAISVCTPNEFHTQPTIDALSKGINVLVEKPVAISAERCRKMVAAAEKAGRILMIGQTLRFSGAGEQMKFWVDKGEIGDIYFGRAQYLRMRGAPGSPGFISRELAAGGPIYDIGVHVLDLTLWLMGFPEPVTASAGVYKTIASRKSPILPFKPEDYTVPDDAAFSLIRFANGATVILECSWLLNIPNDFQNVLICGDRGGASMDPTQLVRERNGVMERIQNATFPYHDRGWGTEEVRQFVEAVQKGKPSPVPATEALITQRILDAIYKSGELGREVPVE